MRALAAWILILGLLAADLGLATDLFRVYAQGVRGLPALSEMEGTPVAPPEDDTLSPASFQLPPLESFESALERPLFSPTRRPLDSAPALDGGAPPRLDVKLVGVVISGDRRIAVLMPRGGKAQELRLNLGQSHDGWTLTAIEPLSATFERGIATETLELQFDQPRPVDPGARRHQRRRR